MNKEREKKTHENQQKIHSIHVKQLKTLIFHTNYFSQDLFVNNRPIQIKGSLALPL